MYPKPDAGARKNRRKWLHADGLPVDNRRFIDYCDFRISGNQVKYPWKKN
jgi:hypothetical protein